MAFKNIDELMAYAAANKRRKTVAVAGAADEHTLEAALLAAREGFVSPIFIGDREKIEAILAGLGEGGGAYPIFHALEPAEMAAQAVRLVREGRADFIMKGLLNTSDVLRAVLNKENGLRHGGTVTVMAMLEVPGYHKLLTINDAAIIPYPTLESKATQIRLVTGMLHKLGYGDDIKVGAVCANENVSPKIVETVEADALKQMNRSGEITGCIVEGPISIDIALRPEIAKGKGFDSPVAGDADFLIFPSLVSANCYSKAVEMTGARAVSFVVGAQVPIALTSRTTTVENKYCTLAITSAMV